MKEIGEYLKASREEKGISIEEVSEDLKLDYFAIAQVEEGNKNVFKDIYELRTFVQQYSKYLCLDVDKITEEFNEFLFEYTSKIPIIEDTEPKEEVNKKKVASPYTLEDNMKKKSNKKTIIIISVVAAIVLIIVALLFIL